MKKLIAIALLAFAGCDFLNPQGRTLALVNGKPLTEKYVRDVIRIQAEISALKGKPIAKGDIGKWGNTLVPKIFSGLVGAEALAQGIEKAGITPGTNETSAALAKYNRLFRRACKTENEICDSFGELKKTFTNLFRHSCLFNALDAHCAKQTATDEEVKDFIGDRRIILEVSKELDRKGKENADKAWKRLKAGEDWDTVAKECSEDKLVDPENESFSKDWAMVGADAMGYPALAEALRTLHKGDYSRPVDIDEGLVIVKVLEEGQAQFTLARMLFRMAEPVEIPTEEEARRQVVAEKTAKAKDAFLEKVHSETKYEYPEGTNFNFKVFGSWEL